MRRRQFIKSAGVLAIVPSIARGQFATFQDLAYLAGPLSSVADGVPRDDMESYADLAAVGGLNGGSGWNGAYVDRVGNIGIHTNDNMESYTDSAAVNGLNAGVDWNGAYVDRNGDLGIQANDNMETYTDSASVNGLNDGSAGWNGAYVDR